ncbi:MAG: hypothetical protein ACI89L_001264 [Phycisphaerales bacterium]|jgi:hypothetical protein
MLLSKWSQFAQASLALPDDGDGPAWKASVGHIITLHSVTMALHEIDTLPDEDRPVAIDRAEYLCREATEAIHNQWRGEPLPESLAELIDDARVAFEASANAGVEWVVSADRLVLQHPGDLAQKLARMGFAGELFVAAPGQPVFRGAPAAFARAPGGAAPTQEQLKLIGRFLGLNEGKVGQPERIATPRQVYRQFDFGLNLGSGGGGAGGGGGLGGGPVKDLVVPMNEPLPPGQPILVLAIEGGEPCGVPLGPTSPVRIDNLPVEIWPVEIMGESVAESKPSAE